MEKLFILFTIFEQILDLLSVYFNITLLSQNYYNILHLRTAIICDGHVFNC